MARASDIELAERIAQWQWKTKRGGRRQRDQAEYELQRLQIHHKDSDGLAEISFTPIAIEFVSNGFDPICIQMFTTNTLQRIYWLSVTRRCKPFILAM